MVDQSSSDDPVAVGLSGLLGKTHGGIAQRQSRLAELEAEASTLKLEIKRLRQGEAVLGALAAECERGHWCEVVRQIDRAKDLRAIVDTFAEGTSTELPALRGVAAERAEESLGDLSSALPAAIEAREFTLDPSSRFPLFRLRNGFFEVRINRSKFEAQITVRHGHTLRVAADLNVIVAAIEQEDARCFGSALDLDDFVARLRDAYMLALGEERPRPLPIEEVRQAIAEPTPPRDEFAVALAAVLRDRPPAATGMNLDHTKSIDTGFLLPGFEDRGYFGHISFTTHPDGEESF